MSYLERGFAEALPYSRGYEAVSPAKTDTVPYISCCDEWKDILHLMNVNAKGIAKKAPTELSSFEFQYLLQTLEANQKALCAGLLDRN